MEGCCCTDKCKYTAAVVTIYIYRPVWVQLDTSALALVETGVPLLLPGQWCGLQAGAAPSTTNAETQYWKFALCTPLALLAPMRARVTTDDGRLNPKLARMVHAQLHPSAAQRMPAFQTHGPHELKLLEAATAMQARHGGGLFLTPKVGKCSWHVVRGVVWLLLWSWQASSAH